MEKKENSDKFLSNNQFRINGIAIVSEFLEDP